jgi:tetratricopeptide (TPR) repeat protein
MTVPRGKILTVALTAVLAGGCGSEPQVSEDFNLLEAASYFTGASNRERTPRLSLLRDSTNNRITVACIAGTPVSQLEAPATDALDERLRALTEGKVLKISDGRCSPAFPVFVGRDREVLRDITDAGVDDLVPLVERLVRRLEGELGGRREMLFHLLWSRMIDVIWSEAWELAFLDDELPVVAWVVQPEHPFAVGTNFASLPGDASLAMTWSPNFDKHLWKFPDANYELLLAAWGEEIADVEAKAGLQAYGLFDASGESRLFSYPDGSRLDETLYEMAMEYAAAAAKAYDWEEVAQRLGIHPGDAFVVVLHEAAYEQFEDLYENGVLEIPSPLLEGGATERAVELVSVVRGEPPGPSDEAMALFMKNGWHGSGEVVARFREALLADPDDIELLWFLGLSLYDVEEYAEAVRTFERVLALAEGDSDFLFEKDWSRIWIGHVYDVTGQRARAMTYYQSVLDSAETSGQGMMGQYNIGPIDVKEWAAQRLETPFARTE